MNVLINPARAPYTLPADNVTTGEHWRAFARVLGRVLGYLAAFIFCVAWWMVFYWCAFAGVLSP